MISYEPNTPQFEHDCDACTFLGRWRGYYNAQSEKPSNYDLYVCVKSRTVIARFGDEGSAYASGLEFVGTINPLTEAKNRAVAMGIDFKALNRKDRDERMRSLSTTIKHNRDVLRVLHSFETIQLLTIFMDNEDDADLAVLLEENGFEEVEINAALVLAKTFRAVDEEAQNET